jgi:TetR/AcrR family transcriptional regulator
MNVLKTETEEKILNAALEVFIEKGLQGARMQEIADRAGINKALLHYYFRSKDQLFDAIFQQVFHKAISEFGQMMKEQSHPLDLVKTLISFYNNFFLENPYMPQFFFHEIWQNPDRIAGLIKSQEIDPEALMANLKDKIPPISDSQFFIQHMIANVMGMLLFPHIARPLFQRLFFNNDQEVYGQFLSERTDFLLNIFNNLMDDHPTGEKDQAPDDNF